MPFQGPSRLRAGLFLCAAAFLAGSGVRAGEGAAAVPPKAAAAALEVVPGIAEVPYRTGQLPPPAAPGEEWYLYMQPLPGEPSPDKTVTEKVLLPTEPDAARQALPAVVLPETVSVAVTPAHVRGRVVPATFIRKTREYPRVAAHHPGAVLRAETLSVVVAPAHVAREWQPVEFEAAELDLQDAARLSSLPVGAEPP